jgi:simple sugar transport system ATP-binding protein
VVAGGLAIGSLSARDLARLMVGDEMPGSTSAEQRPPSTELRLILEDVSAQNERGLTALKRIRLEVGVGEILGIAGVAGNGQHELAQVVAGLRLPTHGRLRLDGRDVTGIGARSMTRRGVAHIPEDRMGEGLVGNLPLADNAVLKSYDRPPLAWGPFLRRQRIVRFAQTLLERFNIRGARPDSATRLLSGGQLQRFLLAREMALDPRVIVAVHPTRGLDVAATQQVQEWLVRARDTGASVLLISEDLDEVMQLSDRIAVLYEGEIVGTMPAAAASRAQLGLMMAGADRATSGVA